MKNGANVTDDDKERLSENAVFEDLIKCCQRVRNIPVIPALVKPCLKKIRNKYHMFSLSLSLDICMHMYMHIRVCI